MGDRRFGIVVLIALLIAGASAYGVSTMLQQAQAEALVPMLPVAVASQDISDGRMVGAEDVTMIELPVAAVPPGSFHSADSVVGRVTRLPIFTGETFLPGRLAPVGTGAGLEVKITPGKRAMAIRIDDVAGVSGLIQPNSRVDVLVTINDESQGQNQQTQRAKLFMSNMRVLSVGSQVERGPDGRPMSATTAALEVTPVESEQLAIAANQGKIQLVLRGYGDPDTVETDGATVRGMLGTAPAPVVRSAPARSTARGTTTAAPPPVIVAPAPESKKPDSTVIQVYRRNAMTQQKLEKRDSSPPDTLPR